MNSLTIDIIKLAANAAEICGIFMMANAHIKIHGYVGKIKMVLGALVGNSFSKKAARAGSFVRETRYTTLRGLSFIALGFVANTFVFLYEMATKVY